MKKSLFTYRVLFLGGLIFLASESVCAQKSVGAHNIEKNNNVPIYFPLDKNDFVKMSSAYGYRKHPIHKKKMLHKGIDLVAMKGKPVYATATGVVQKAGYKKDYGNYVLISHLGGIKTLYGHLWVRMIKKGDRVSQGQLIGFVGDTGLVTGPHLHYEIWLRNKKVDPLLVWKNLLKEERKEVAINE